MATFADLKSGDVIRFEVDGVNAERRVALLHREGSYIRLAFDGLLAQFRVYSGWNVEFIRPAMPPVLMCAHCREHAAEWACTRTVERYVRVNVKDLHTGDRLCRTTESEPKTGTHATVDKVESINGYIRYSIAIHRRTVGPRQKTIEATPYATTKRATMVPCGSLICDNCAQDPGEPHRYCTEHWTCRTLEAAA